MAKKKSAVRAKRAGPVDRYIGSKIRLRRHMLGLSQTALAEAVGLTFQQIQKYENGSNRVGPSRLQQISQVLDTSPAWFFEGASNGRRAGPTQAGRAIETELAAFLADAYAARVIRNWSRVPTSVRKAVANLVTRAAGKSGRAEAA